MRLSTPKIVKNFLGEHTPRPPYSTVNKCRVPMFSASANDIAPLDGKSYVWPCKLSYDAIEEVFFPKLAITALMLMTLLRQ